MQLLVTGGAGYVGSICAQRLAADGHEVTVLDDLSRGHRSALPAGAEWLDVDLLDAEATMPALSRAASTACCTSPPSRSSASRSSHPERYWRGNVVGTLHLLAAMRAAAVQRLVFSSTCAVYGEPAEVPIHEDVPTAPVNAYGNSKLAVDRMIADECRAHGLGAVSLRYFNVAGASGALGEDHDPETHLIPLVLQAARGKREHVSIFGTDYPTADGTAVRDYIHIEDLADAHGLGIESAREGTHRIYNLGTGSGYSVREVIEAARSVTQTDDPRARGVAAAGRSRRAGGLLRPHSRRARVGAERTLETMIGDAWAWHQAHPDGYGD